MKNNRTTSASLSLAATAIVGISAASAQADLIEARFDSVSPGRNIEFSTNDGHSYQTTVAGNFNWTRLGGDYDGGGAEGQYVTYCVDLVQHVSYGAEYEFNVIEPTEAPWPTSGMGDDRADRLAELFGRHWSSGFGQDEAAGFQLAVWEIVNDDDLDLADGDFRIRDAGSAQDWANLWLASIDGTGPTADLAVMGSNSRQDQVFMIPTPASGMLAGVGMWLLAGRTRKRKFP
ncbi:MAG: hypothetical protein D8M59_04940 [Planctomycetes bacterium]|nr:hypothetical protein [Planctomycetota bacterium]NOG55854.1 hypothetical protein [Planctomycetota bacterium]